MPSAFVQLLGAKSRRLYCIAVAEVVAIIAVRDVRGYPSSEVRTRHGAYRVQGSPGQVQWAIEHQPDVEADDG